jgi:hypothetical protein
LANQSLYQLEHTDPLGHLSYFAPTMLPVFMPQREEKPFWIAEIPKFQMENAHNSSEYVNKIVIYFTKSVINILVHKPH